MCVRQLCVFSSCYLELSCMFPSAFYNSVVTTCPPRRKSSSSVRKYRQKYTAGSLTEAFCVYVVLILNNKCAFSSLFCPLFLSPELSDRSRGAVYQIGSHWKGIIRRGRCQYFYIFLLHLPPSSSSLSCLNLYSNLFYVSVYSFLPAGVQRHR